MQFIPIAEILPSGKILFKEEPDVSATFLDTHNTLSSEDVLCILSLSPTFKYIPKEEYVSVVANFLKTLQ